MPRLRIPLRIIPAPQPDTRVVFEIRGLFPALKGQGETDLICGECGQVLIEGVGSDAVIKNVVLKCPNCGKYNEIPILSFAEIKKKIAFHLKTALVVEDFKITYAKLVGDIWNVNIEYYEKISGVDFPKSALFTLDAITGEVKEFKRDYTWRF
jgi:phage FluMu protein Com